MNLQIIEKIINPLENKIKKMERHLISTGVILTILAFLVAGTDFMVRFLIAVIVLVIACLCFCLAYKIKEIKKEIFKYFK